MSLNKRIKDWIDEVIKGDRYSRGYSEEIIDRIEKYAIIHNLEYLLVDDILYLYFEWIGMNEEEIQKIIKEFNEKETNEMKLNE